MEKEKKEKTRDFRFAFILLMIVAALFLIISQFIPPVTAYYNISPSTDVMNFTRKNELTNLSENVSWNNFVAVVETPFTAVMGSFFYVFIFSIPAFMMVIRQENIILPLVTGVIISVGGWVYIPAEYRYITVLIIATIFSFLFYKLFKK